MRTIKKVIITALISIVILFAIALGYIWLKNEEATKLAAAYDELETYRSIYEPLGEIITGYVVVSDMQYGRQITEDDIMPIDVTESSAGNICTEIDEIIGKYYRINLTGGTLLSSDVIMDYPQTSDVRAYDVITTYNPIGLEPNDFVDIRFVTPMGEDYIALSHKRVEGVYGGVLKLAMSEYDIMVYNSLVVDKILFSGSSIYATKYLEPGGQEAAEAFYPLSTQVLTAIANDPNITISQVDYVKIASARANLLSNYRQYSDDALVSSLLEAGKSSIPSRIESGQSAYITQKEIEEQKRIEEAITNGGY